MYVLSVFIITFITVSWLYRKLFNSHNSSVNPASKYDRNQQGIEQPDSSGVYRCGILTDRTEPIDCYPPEIRTLYDAFLKGLEKSNNGPCIWYRPSGTLPYRSLSYSEVLLKAQAFGSALVEHLKLRSGNGTYIGIYAKNCPEWFLGALACVQYAMIIVPLYDTLGNDAVKFIIEQTEISLIIVENAEKAKGLINAGLESLKYIVLIDSTRANELQPSNVKIYSFDQLVKIGLDNRIETAPPKPDDVYIICYTSGTTGIPKGVVLTHRNLVANLSAFHILTTNFLPDSVKSDEVEISYLPLAHMMEQICHWCTFLIGSSVGYFSGNIQNLMKDMQDLKPTMFPAVPRLLNRLYDTIQAKVKNSNWLVRMLFRFAYQRKLALLKRGIVSKDTIWDKLFFSSVQNKLGGRVNFIPTGSAPIAAEVLETCRVVLGTVIVEAYGQTECTGLVTSTWPYDPEGGHCGGPASCTLLKLADVPELNYYASEGRGEIMVKGPHVTSGYFKNPEKTMELFDEDGFLHTGDIAQLMSNGAIKIIDRKKHIFKLAQGEYIAPEKIENVYTRTPCVQQIFVDGNSLERFLIAIVVPEEAVIRKWYNANFESSNATYKEILAMKEVHNFVLNEIQNVGKQNKLNSMEQVKAVYLTDELFTVENGLLTPTLKAKRPELRTKYKKIIDDLYRDLKSST